MRATFTLEQCAELRADIDFGRPRDEVLGDAGLTAADWIAVQRSWLDALGREVAHGRFELADRYDAAYSARRQALAATPRDTTASARARSAAPEAPAEVSSTLRLEETEAMPLERYALICAEIAQSPLQKPRILARHQLCDSFLWRAQEAIWQARMRADPALQAQWQALIYQHRHRLKPPSR